MQIDDLSSDQIRQLHEQAEVFRKRNHYGLGGTCAQTEAPSNVGSQIRNRLGYEAAGPAKDASQRLGYLSEEVTLGNVDDAMGHQTWDSEQIAAGDIVRETLVAAVKAVLRVVPRCPNRTKAINHLIDARMDANAAISFRGRF